jgi:hypothetical protein
VIYGKLGITCARIWAACQEPSREVSCDYGKLGTIWARTWGLHVKNPFISLTIIALQEGVWIQAKAPPSGMV